MSVNSVSSAVSTTGTSNNPIIASNGSDLSNMFLNLLVAQISHQNPLNPQDGTQFVSQLAQFSSLESLQSIKQNTADTQTSLNTLQVLDATKLVGTEVNVQTGTQVLEQQGNIKGQVNLSAAADSVTAQLYNADGELIEQQQLPYSGQGTLNFQFDDQDAGAYTVKVYAQSNGLSTNLQPWLSGQVERVSVGNSVDDILLQVNGLGNFNLSDINQLVTQS
ncbi:flagellar hook capping FlgD N-terminal domain-containing protein [Shewanella sp. A32]|uniref:flagellar hook assembly protein FlgD n=1 Tax=Shewanella sp. A32 TaxID=3031327 RepID=UPI0023B9D2E4|nr:flagellar hook capping FlgD N-terminal domain-containing protein [Shewanella sp. A32]MDF0535741.1 flagellar hook capping FlgD N-terminal domain-containing protein [Shewanella sp. A32]